MANKITFTSNGESHELPIDSSKTLRPGNVSPDMKLTVTGSFNPPPLITFNQNHQPIMTIHPDGKITLGENAQPTEAAAACIEAMSHMLQSIIDRAVSEERAAIVAWMRRYKIGNFPYSIVETLEISSRQKALVDAVEAGVHLK